jgi:hypothetical protein
LGSTGSLTGLVDGDLEARGSEVAAQLHKTPPQIVTAAIRRKGACRVEHRLLHRYLTTGDDG